MRRLWLVVVLPVLLAACGAEPIWAPEEQVQAALHRHDGPPALTLYTVISNRSGGGAHSALMVNSTHRAIFDPAGTFKHPVLPERNDVHFGITERARELYIDYHARETYHVVEQTIAVTPEQAALAMRLIQENGAVPKAMCSSSVTNILRQVPGFETIPQSMFPKKPMEAFGALPGARTVKFYDDSPDNRGDLTAVPQL